MINLFGLLNGHSHTRWMEPMQVKKWIINSKVEIKGTVTACK
jgi:hypothetical protein